MKISGTSVLDLFDSYKQRLSSRYSHDEIRHIFYLVFESSFGWSKSKILLSYQEFVSDDISARCNQILEELKSGKPIQYILGVSWFNGAMLHVDQRVLIPRPETEELCSIIHSDIIRDFSTVIDILDIGTGSGCIAIDLKRRFPQATITAFDVSMDALELAGENALSLGCNINFQVHDILGPLGEADHKVDIIVSNPPYVTDSEYDKLPLNVSGFEPGLALIVPDNDPLRFYKAIADYAIVNLNPKGRIYFEINERFGVQMREMLIGKGFFNVDIMTDLSGKPRFIRAISG